MWGISPWLRYERICGKSGKLEVRDLRGEGGWKGSLGLFFPPTLWPQSHLLLHKFTSIIGDKVWEAAALDPKQHRFGSGCHTNRGEQVEKGLGRELVSVPCYGFVGVLQPWLPWSCRTTAPIIPDSWLNWFCMMGVLVQQQLETKT